MTPRCSLVVHKDQSRRIMTVVAVFTNSNEAQAWADNANEWYGEDHPITPLEVEPVEALSAPPLFPVGAFRTMKEESAEQERLHAAATQCLLDAMDRDLDTAP